MSPADLVSRTVKKRSSDTAAVPAPDGDHRKRRRNRVTQSCLNCHSSKRMCDRKRPACARCTQLGLTGLCVYEVDDPNQRPEAQDESSRLIKRVAELEGVIREMKNKPHPRWAKPVNAICDPGDEFDKWHSRAQKSSTDVGLIQMDDDESSLLLPPSPVSDKAEAHPRSSVIHPSNVYPGSSYYSASPGSISSPLLSPTDEYPRSSGQLRQNASSPEFDLASMFLSYPALMNCHDSYTATAEKANPCDDVCYIKDAGGHCGCLHESASYNVVLELSLRLRRASEVLMRSTNHQMGTNCLLTQRIADLDTLTSNTLGCIPSPLNEVQPHFSVNEQDHANQVAIGMLPSEVYTNGCRPMKPTNSLSLGPWDITPAASDSPESCDDSYMTWEPRRG